MVIREPIRTVGRRITSNLTRLIITSSATTCALGRSHNEAAQERLVRSGRRLVLISWHLRGSSSDEALSLFLAPWVSAGANHQWVRWRYTTLAGFVANNKSLVMKSPFYPSEFCAPPLAGFCLQIKGWKRKLYIFVEDYWENPVRRLHLKWCVDPWRRGLFAF